jgi:hypothetical protein
MGRENSLTLLWPEWGSNPIPSDPRKWGSRDPTTLNHQNKLVKKNLDGQRNIASLCFGPSGDRTPYPIPSLLVRSQSLQLIAPQARAYSTIALQKCSAYSLRPLLAVWLFYACVNWFYRLNYLRLLSILDLPQ